MNEEAALIAACHMHPDEDTPRLVLADWYQEHDQPDRAEFIRLSVEIHRTPSKGHGQGPYHTTRLRERARKLLAAHPEWIPECPACKGTGKLQYNNADGTPSEGPTRESMVGERSDVCCVCNGKKRRGLIERGLVVPLSVEWDTEPEKETET